MEIMYELSRYKCVEEKELQSTSKPSSPQSIASSTNSPSHEFSFTISLHPSSTSSSSSSLLTSTRKEITKSSHQEPSPPFAIDLSPADDIFSHGRLLPLHSLPHIPINIPPRSSTSSIDSFTIPFSDEQFNQEQPQNIVTNDNFIHDDHQEVRKREKSKSFSRFGLPKWRKTELEEKKEKEDENREKKKLSSFLKRYIKMIRPFLSNIRSGNRRDGNMGSIKRQPHSFSGTLSSLRGSNKKAEMRGRSAPASMWTSPTNSGHLVATPGTSMNSPSDSSMEELQAAIEAAIAHCKNSIAVEDSKVTFSSCREGDLLG